jgi:hypothetical protein
MKYTLGRKAVRTARGSKFMFTLDGKVAPDHEVILHLLERIEVLENNLPKTETLTDI